MVETQSSEPIVQAMGNKQFIYLTKEQINLLKTKPGNKLIATLQNPYPEKIHKPTRGWNLYHAKKKKEEERKRKEDVRTTN